MGPLGILGGGQLGRMTLQAASRLGIAVVIAEQFPNSPAAQLTSTSVIFERGWNDPSTLERLSKLAPVITLENEFVDWRVLQCLEELGTIVRPSPMCVGVVQDKLLQKQALARAEFLGNRRARQPRGGGRRSRLAAHAQGATRRL